MLDFSRSTVSGAGPRASRRCKEGDGPEIRSAGEWARRPGGCGSRGRFAHGRRPDGYAQLLGYLAIFGARRPVRRVLPACLRADDTTGKAANDPGGVVANALAYNTEYAKAEATKKYAEAAANRKSCELPKKRPSVPSHARRVQPHHTPRRQPRHTRAVNARSQDSAGFLNRSVSDFLTSNADVSIFVSQSRVARPLSATIAQHSRY